jgi:hypothetical protein
MAVYEHKRDLLEVTVYRRLVSLSSEFSDAHGSEQSAVAQPAQPSEFHMLPATQDSRQAMLQRTRQMSSMVCHWRSTPSWSDNP